jgi:alcohol dehydrogenase class IV
MNTFSFPTLTLFGAGALAELPSRLKSLGLKRPLVVTDEGVAKTAILDEIGRVLPGERGNGWFVFTRVQPNPLEGDVRAAAQAYAQHACDGVIGLGGGSPLDVGKAVRLLVKRPGLNFEKFYEETDWSGLAPFIAIPTTAGTGSEVGRSSVITLEATGRKAVLFNRELLAALVILDPRLTVGLPPHLTAATGADALTHCIESFTCPVFHPMCDGIALEGIHLIVEALPRAYRNGADLDARGRMLVAAAMGAVAFQKDLGLVHSLAHPLSTVCGLHHGLANALCLPIGMRFCAERKPGIYRRVGIACGLELARTPDVEADRSTIAFITEFLRYLGLSTKLREHGVKPEHIDRLVAQAVDDPCHKTNVVPVSEADFRKLYLEVL